MKIQLKNRFDLSVIFECEADSLKLAVELAIKKKISLSSANLSRADLSSANLSSANLSYANLSRADLSNANLSYANLSYANLSRADLFNANLYDANLYDANLSYANLSSANLFYAKGINKNLCTPLIMLFDQPSKIRAYKLVTAGGIGPFYGGIIYEIGKSYEVMNSNIDNKEQCGTGINLATLDWCMKEWRDGYRILIAEFAAVDIAAIPIGTDGKFRVQRCTIVGEKDLKEIGLIENEQTLNRP